MKPGKIEELLERFYNGETSLEEERELKSYFEKADVPPHLQLHKPFFAYVKKQKAQPSLISDEALFAKMETSEKERSKGKTITLNFTTEVLWRVAAVLVLIAVSYWVGFTAGSASTTATTNNQPPTNEIAALRQDMEEMKLMLMQESSPSMRLKAVSYATEVSNPDAELIQVLINTMNFDDNVNVRMAAIDALLLYKKDPTIRLALTNSLKIQEDPNVQLMLIEGLVKMREKEAVDEMQQLLKKENLQEIVKTKLQEGIGILI